MRMITVEPTHKNWEIYSQLCELDAEFRVCNDEQGRRDIISLAQKLCQEIEKPDIENSEENEVI